MRSAAALDDLTLDVSWPQNRGIVGSARYLRSQWTWRSFWVCCWLCGVAGNGERGSIATRSAARGYFGSQRIKFHPSTAASSSNSQARGSEPHAQASVANAGPGQLVRVPGMRGVGGYLALDDVVNLEHFWLTGVDAELGENRHEACSERLELFL